jgi:4-hydroxy 2-oxovalerate aldolase
MESWKDKLNVMDVTLRDGSYLIDFQFTFEDTAFICKALESIGVEWIEVGHGVGLGASNKGFGVAAASDEEYMEAASNNIKNAKWGKFFIPNVGSLADIDLAAKYNMSFIRIGSNIDDIEQNRVYIERAKEKGMIVTYNAMKSYAVSPTQFAKSAKQMSDWGVDIMYLVDSAGGLLPNDVEDYFKATQQETDIAIGFHGHDNLCLAMANTLKAIECGATIVDSSLQGMGRSAGNAITEVLFAILKQKSLFPNVNLKEIMDLGDRVINPLIKNKTLDSMAITSGYARFHSSFTSKVKKYATKYNIDTRDLIVKLCQEDLINAPEDLLEKFGQELANDKVIHNKRIIISNPKVIEDKSSIEKLQYILKELKINASKFGKFSTLNIVISQKEDSLKVSGNIHSNETYVIGSITLPNIEYLKDVISFIESYVHIVLLDIDKQNFGFEQISKFKNFFVNTILLTYNDADIWVDSIKEQILRTYDENIFNKNIAILGDDYKAILLCKHLESIGAKVQMLSNESENYNFEKIDSLVLWSQIRSLTQSEIASFKKGSLIIDAIIGSLSTNLISDLLEKNIKITRVNIWASLCGVLSSIHESFKTQKLIFGRKNIDGVYVVSGGFIGNVGDVIVDNVNDITKIIGIADGNGGVRYNYESQDVTNIEFVKSIIYSKFYKTIV